jgi:serine/threonine-protein kinase RsbW
VSCDDFYSTHVPSRISCIGTVVNEFIISLQNSYGCLDDLIIFELKVILNEVLLNAVRHGNGEDEHKLVKVRAGVNRMGNMVLVVEDEGTGYNYNDVCNCRKPCCGIEDPMEISEHGRGIIIIKGLSDKVEINERGNRIIISKNIF